MSGPVVMVVRAVPKAGKSEELLAVLRELVPIVHEEAGCELYSLHVDGNGDVVFIEKWASQEDLDRHSSASPVLPALAERATPLLAAAPTIATLTPAPAGGPKGAL